MNTTVHRLAMSIQQYAVAAYIQGALSVYADNNTPVPSQTLCKVTDDAIDFVNASLVVTSYANVHHTMQTAARARYVELFNSSPVAGVIYDNGIELITVPHLAPNDPKEFA